MGKKYKKFSSILNVEELVKYLGSSQRDKDYIFHYTTIDKLAKILNSKSIRLSNPGSMNDLNEFSGIALKDTFLGSFNRDSNESVAMWGMYSIPWEVGVRIAIPTNAFRKWLKDLKIFKDHKNCDINLKYKKLINVCYVNESNSKFEWSNQTLYLKNKIELQNWKLNPLLHGYIKDGAWKYESEVRVVITIENEISQNYIDVPLSDEIIKSLKITLSPKFNLNDKTLKILENLNFEDSKYKSIIVPKTVCDSCIYEYECCQDEQ